MASFDPTIAGAVRRFKRVVLVALGVGLVGSVAYTVIAGASYTSTAGIIIAPLPANISPTTSGSASGVQNYTGVQVAMLRSLEVSNQAAAIVNREAPNAHLSGQHLHQNLVVAPPGTSSKGSTTNGSLTNVTVTLGSSKTAMDAANAVLQAYEGQLKVQIHRQAATSVAAYNAEIANASAQLSG